MENIVCLRFINNSFIIFKVRQFDISEKKTKRRNDKRMKYFFLYCCGGKTNEIHACAVMKTKPEPGILKMNLFY